MLFDGTAENDRLTGTPGNDTINGFDSNDDLFGEAGDDSIIGGEGNDDLYGDVGDDTLDGESGDDYITFGAGANIVDGGDGSDRVDLDFSSESEDFVFNYSKNGSLTNRSFLEGTTISDVERVSIASGSGNDVINIAATNNNNEDIRSGEGDDRIIGGEGNDDLFGEAGDDSITGGEGNDDLYGGEGNDTLNGESGDDYITFGAGANIVNGGDGSDRVDLDFSSESEAFVFNYSKNGSLTNRSFLEGTIISDVERVSIASGSGNDVINIAATNNNNEDIRSGEGDDRIIGGEGNDDLFGEAGDDSITGGEGNDDLYGGEGNDTLNGESGDDYITFGAGANIVNGGDGSDRVDLDFSSESEIFIFNYVENGGVTRGSFLDGTTISNIERVSIASGSGNDIINITATNNSNDDIRSGAGNDVVIGGEGNDDLFGEAGDDLLTGSEGNDDLYGGEGEDVAVFSGSREDYEILVEEDSVTVTNSVDRNFLFEIETIRFDNGDFNISSGEFTTGSQNQDNSVIINDDGIVGTTLSDSDALNFFVEPTLDF